MTPTTREIAEKLYETVHLHWKYKDCSKEQREAFESVIDELISPRMAEAVIGKDGDRWERLSDGKYRCGYVVAPFDHLLAHYSPLKPAPDAPAPPELGETNTTDPAFREQFAEAVKAWVSECRKFADAMMLLSRCSNQPSPTDEVIRRV